MAKFGGGAKCVKCAKSVYANEKTSFEGQVYHHKCFLCSICSKKIADVSKAGGMDGDVFHRRCFENQFRASGGKFGGKAVDTRRTKSSQSSQRSVKKATQAKTTPKRASARNDRRSEPSEALVAAACRIQRAWRHVCWTRTIKAAVLADHDALQTSLYGNTPREKRGEWKQLLSAPLVMPALAERARASSAEISDAVFRGCFDAVLRNVSVDTTVTCFVSSTFTDTKLERDMLISDVYPYLNRLASKHGLQFIPSEMRWGIREESSNAHRTSEICMTELGRCQEVSLGVNYVALLGNKYGFRPFPAVVSSPHFELLVARIPDSKDIETVRSWYMEDCNVVPPLQRLKPVSKATKGDWWGKDGHEGAFFVIQRCLRAAAQGVRNSKERTEEMRNLTRQFEISVTHDEVNNGLLDIDEQTRTKKVFLFQRDLQGMSTKSERAKDSHKALASNLFYDMNKGTLDEEAQTLNEEMKANVRAQLPAERVAHTILQGAVLDPRKADHMDYLRTFCDRFCRIMTDSILTAAVRQRQNSKDEVYTEVVAHNVVCRNKAMQFQGQEQLLKGIADYCAGTTPALFVMWGGSGCGKSSAMAKAAYDVYSTRVQGKASADGPVPNVIIRFLGTSVGSFGVLELLTSLCLQLERIYPAALLKLPADARSVSPDFQKLQIQFRARLKWATEAQPLVVFLDSADQLSDRNAGRGLRWLPHQLPPNVRLVVSTLPNEGGCLAALRTADASLSKDEARTIFAEVPRLSKEDSTQILDSWLSADRRRLTATQRATVFEGFDQAPLPLYLKLAYDVSLEWKSTDTVAKLAGSVRGVIGVIFDALESTHGKILVSHGLSAMTAARHGLSDGQMQDLLSIDDQLLNDVFEWWTPPIRRVPPLLWTRLRSDLREYVVDRGVMGVAVHSWYHRQFWELAEARYLDANNEPRVQIMLAEFFADKYVYGKSISNHHDKERLDRKLTPLLDDVTDLFQDLAWKREQEFPAGDTKRYTPNAVGFVGSADVPASRKHAMASVLFHLVKAGDVEGARTRLLTLDFLATYLEAHSPLALLMEMDQFLEVESCPDVLLVSKAMKLAGPKLVVHPSQLYEQLSLRLRDANKERAGLTRLLDPDRWVRMGWEASARKDRGMPLLFPAFPWDPETAQAGGYMMLKQEWSARFDCVLYLTQRHQLACGSDDGSVLVYDATNGDLLGQLLGTNNAMVVSLALNADESKIAAGDAEGHICVFELASSKMLYDIRRAHQGTPVSGMCFLDDGRIASGGGDHAVCIWKKDSSELGSTLEGHLDAVSCVSAGPAPGGEPAIFSGSLDGSVRVWKQASGECVATWGAAHTSSALLLKPGDLSFADNAQSMFQRRWTDGKVVEINLQDKTVVNRDEHSGDLFTLSMDRIKSRDLPHETTCMAFGTVQGVRVIAVGFLDGFVEVWNVETGAKVSTTVDSNAFLLCVAVSPDGKYLIGGGREKVLAVWDIDTGKLVKQMEGHTSYLKGMLLLEQGGVTTVATVSLDRCVIEWDLNKCLQYEAPPLGHDSYVYDIDLSSDGTKACSVCMVGSVVVWDVATGTMLNRFVTPGAKAMGMGDGSSFVTGHNGDPSYFQVFEWNKQEAVRRVDVGMELIRDMNVAQDVVILCGGNMLCAYTVSTGQPIFRKESAAGLAWQNNSISQDASLAVAARSDGTMCVIDVAQGNIIREFELGDFSGLTDVRVHISPNKKYVVAVDNKVRMMAIFDLEQGKPIHIVPDCHTHALYTPAFSSCSQYALCGGADEKMTVWSVATGECTMRMAAPSHCVCISVHDGWYVLMVGGKEVTGFAPWIAMS